MTLSEFSIEALKETVTGDNGLTPYQSGPNLIKLYGHLGIRDTYSYQGGGLPDSMSRNQYAVDRMKKLNGSKEMKRLFEMLVDSRHLKPNGTEAQEVATHVNEIIKHDGYKLVEVDGIYTVSGENLPEGVEVEVHFEDIQNQILEQLSLAKFTIWVAVAWFTDKILFSKLIEKKKEGVNVQVIMLDDDINRQYGVPANTEFEAYKVQPTGYYKNIMHHKFCVIDLRTVIHGSYNWSNKARWNKETISIDTGREIAEKFATEFIKLKK